MPSPQPLRVGLVIGQLTTGGAEGQLRLLCGGFDRQRVDPIVYCLSEQTEPYGPALTAAGVPVRVIAGGRLGRLAALRRALAADRIQVAHAWLFIANAYAWLATRGGPALVTSARNCKRSGRVLDALNRQAFRASDAIIANSAQVRDYIAREYGAPVERIAVVRNAIDLGRFQPRAAGAAPDGPRIVMVGRLVAQKNPLLFVAAAAALRARLPQASFTLVGDGPLRGAVAAAVHAAGLDGALTLAGEQRDVSGLLRQADLFWLTSDWEGLPNAVIEALASGLPVVATDVGGTAELITAGIEGELIAAGDRAALVERSLAILADPARHAAMRHAARQRAEAFGLARMVADTESVYAQALERRAA
ncbi:MAG: glycosyltransferase [Deltaproteobacteria bacterium]|nr:glycosyltransferase [Deltaproteobacteria bacterium]